MTKKSHRKADITADRNHETWTEATWTSVFAAPCWISPLYYSTTVDDDDNILTGRNNKEHHHHHQPLHSSSSSTASSVDADTTKRTSTEKEEYDEVFGWTLDATARGVAVMGTAVFVSSICYGWPRRRLDVISTTRIISPIRTKRLPPI